MRIKDKSIKKIVVITIIILVPFFSQSASFASPYTIETNRFGALLNNVFCSTLGKWFGFDSCKKEVVIKTTEVVETKVISENKPTIANNSFLNGADSDLTLAYPDYFNNTPVTSNTNRVVETTATSNTVKVPNAIKTPIVLSTQPSSPDFASSLVTHDFLSRQAGALGDSFGRSLSSVSSNITTNGSFTTPTITGGSITGASFSGTVDASTLSVSGNSIFDTDTLYVDATTNRVGIGTSSPSDTLSVNGPIFLANTTPSATQNRLYSSSNSLYWSGNLIGGATTGTWDSDGTNVYRTSGYVGIGTSSPTVNLDVAGKNSSFNSSQDGSLGSWTTNTNNLVHGNDQVQSVISNGYIYALNGANGNYNQYAKLNADGSTGTWANTTAFPENRAEGGAVTANGYIYYIGGGYWPNYKSNTVYYGKVNNDGTISSWTTNVNYLPTVRGKFPTTVTANGYVYVIGGEDDVGATSTIIYAKLNANGSTGPWTTNGSNIPQAIANHSSVVANGYVYVLGGNGSSGETSAVYYAKLNSDGSIGNWQNTTALPFAIYQHSSVVLNGYVYVIGGQDETNTGTFVTTVSFAKLNSNGTVGSWSSTASLPSTLILFGSVTANGYIYTAGGYRSNPYQVVNNVYYTSGARVKIAGSLDLLGLNTSGAIGDSSGEVGGSIFAGNIFSANKLEVSGNTQLWNGLSINGATSIFASSSSATESIFNIATTTNRSLFTVLNSGNLGIGTTSPYAKLSVVGETVAAYFTATTTATSTFANLSGLTTGAMNVFAGTPAQSASSVAGNNLVLKASDATAGASTQSGANGGSVNIMAGNGNALDLGGWPIGVGGAVNITAGRGAVGSNSGSLGGAINITSGSAYIPNVSGGDGGAINITTGLPGYSGSSGAINISSGGAANPSGNVTLSTGDTTAGGAGNLTIKAGSSNFNAFGHLTPGGSIYLTTQIGAYTTNISGVGGMGGSQLVTLGAGGLASHNTAGTGGNGGAYSILGGTGGAATGAGGTHTGGIGSTLSFTSGTGGSATGASGTRTGGAGGNVVFNLGLGGTGATANGTGGKFGIGTSSPYALLSLATPPGALGDVTTLFNISSSTASATTSLFTVLNNGNVGVGTENPMAKLEVNGSVNIGGIILNNSSSILTSNNGANFQNSLSASSAGAYLQIGYAKMTQVNGATTFINNTNTRQDLIIPNGNVGIGTTSPSAKLSITQSSLAATSSLWIAGTDGDFRATYMSDTSGVLSFYGGDTAGTLNTATLNAAGAWTNASDISYKENIVDLGSKYSLGTIMSLQPRYYKMKGLDMNQIGFIAQELEQFVPEVVEGQDGSKGISYGNLSALTVSAIQDLSTILNIASTTDGRFSSVRLDELETRLLTLENKNAVLLTGTTTADVSFSFDSILESFANLGIKIIDKVVTVTKLVANKITGNTVEFIDGLQTVDRTTGETYCMYIDRGDWIKTKGECKSITVATPIPTPVPSPTPSIVPEIPIPTPATPIPEIPTPAPSVTPEPSPTPTIVPETPTPTPIPETPTPMPSVTPEIGPTPEVSPTPVVPEPINPIIDETPPTEAPVPNPDNQQTAPTADPAP